MLHNDLGFSVERCRSGLGSAMALVVGASSSPLHGSKKYWIEREAFWKRQLEFAEKREGRYASQ